MCTLPEEINSLLGKMEVAGLIAGATVVRKIYQKVPRDSNHNVNQTQHPGYVGGNVGMQQQYAAGSYVRGNVGMQQQYTAGPYVGGNVGMQQQHAAGPYVGGNVGMQQQYTAGPYVGGNVGMQQQHAAGPYVGGNVGMQQQYAAGPYVGGNMGMLQQYAAGPYVGGNVGMQQQYAAGPYVGGNVGVMQCQDARPWSSFCDKNAIYQYFCEASMRQFLAMLVDGVYSRDQGAMDIPLIERQYIEDARAEEYARCFWTRMRGITDEEERNVGLKHYLRIVPNNLHNKFHNRYRLVIALRGTKPSSVRDIVDDIKVACHTLHCSKRYKATEGLIQNILSIFQEHYNGVPSEVCITGHSLGAAIALLIGKDLAKDTSKRYDVQCFNPPLFSVLMLIQKVLFYDRVKVFLKRCEVLQPLLRIGSDIKQLGKVVLVVMFGDPAKLSEEFWHFERLTDWKPVLYVNEGDWICKEYQRFYDWKHGRNLGLPIHMQTLVSRIVKKNARYSCLVPSVDMHVCQGNKRCHALKQWYTDDELKPELREYRLLSDVRFSGDHGVDFIHDVIGHVIAQFNQVPGHTAMRHLSHLPAEYPRYTATVSTLNDQAAFDGCYDSDDEIAPDSAEATLLELESPSARTMYDSGYMQQGGNWQQTSHSH